MKIGETMTSKPKFVKDNRNDKFQFRASMLAEEVKVIQGIMDRLNTNSNYLKCMTVFLVTLFSVFATDLAATAIFPIVTFWYLDAYYVRLGALYVKVHNELVDQRPRHINDLFNLNPFRFSSEVSPIWRIMGIETGLIYFYGSLNIVTVLVQIMKQYGTN